MEHKTKISQKNKNFLEKIIDLKKIYSLVGLIDIGGLPAKQFQMIRSSLNEYSKILIVKKSLIKIAFQNFEKNDCKNILKLLEGKDGILGLIFLNENPFKICKIINQNKSNTFIKVGDICEKEIIVPSGGTGFAPGPILGELSAVGIKVGVVDGKIEIKEDCSVAKPGDKISQNLAMMLSRLEIEPVEVGLNVLSIWDNGIIYDKETLFTDEKKFLENLKSAITRTNNLSVGLGFFNKNTIKPIIIKYYQNSISLARGIDYISKDTIKEFLSSASNKARIINNKIGSDKQ